jgi:deoxyribodipyrimidine photo-lyase
MPAKKAIVWFRQDLRLRDNTALIHAAKTYDVIPVYILDDANAGEWKMGGASRWWLHQSLSALNESLDGNLVVRAGKADKIIPELVKEYSADAVFWNRFYEPWRIARDKKIKASLEIECESFKDFLLWEPWELLKEDKTPYKVFTPYYRRGCLSKQAPEKPKNVPKINFASTKNKGKISDLGLMPSIEWYKTMEKTWTPGEKGARSVFKTFLDDGLKGYKLGRNFPDKQKTSRLSPYLHFGEISIREAWHGAIAAAVAQNAESDVDTFCSELGWREFSNYLLYHFPQLPREPLQKKFGAFPWYKNAKHLAAWQRGQTGIPIIDAGMRELWQTGVMHNRVRMIVASFLVKNLLINWHEGEDWFWDCLVDADLANNSASWQWVAGCGADAAPYFRVFNPVTQGEKFDPNGDYVRRYVPELKNVPLEYLHKPWEMDDPPKNYPKPLVDLKKSRVAALEAYKEIK